MWYGASRMLVRRREAEEVTLEIGHIDSNHQPLSVNKAQHLVSKVSIHSIHCFRKTRNSTYYGEMSNELHATGERCAMSTQKIDQ